MARSIVVKFKGKESKFNFKKISRSVLYGKKKRVFLDEHDKECALATIDTAYGVLIRSGDASSVHIDDQRNFIDKGEISGLDLDGKTIERISSTLDVPQDLQQTDEQYVLDCRCASLYHLKEEVLEKDLQASLENGDLYRFDFNYYSDFRVETGILLKNDLGYFALIGKETSVSWTDKGEALSECFETPEDGDIDFEML